MEVILVTLSQLFANNLEQFKVPAYQRRYSWNTDQIEELFNDIVSQNDHLLGMLILFRVNINIYDIGMYAQTHTHTHMMRARERKRKRKRDRQIDIERKRDRGKEKRARERKRKRQGDRE